MADAVIQRSNFSRFYFIGDDDLLAIIGGGTDVHALFRHLTKMFAGVAALTTEGMRSRDGLSEDKSEQQTAAVLNGMSSREGETVLFVSPIITADYPSINALLTRVEGAMVSHRL